MGEVYEVEDRQLGGDHVALKTILSRFASDPLMRERFRREVLIEREIRHAHVCPISYSEEWKRPEGLLLYLTMKLLEGETLAERLRRQGPLPSKDTSLIARQIASGIGAAHDQGILHRDIKASHIILGGQEDRIHAWITDFGLARTFTNEAT